MAMTNVQCLQKEEETCWGAKVTTGVGTQNPQDQRAGKDDGVSPSGWAAEMGQTKAQCF